MENTQSSPIDVPIDVPIVVVGGGSIGLITALVAAQWCERNKEKLVIVFPSEKKIDKRTTAILNKGIEFLEKLEIWNECQNDSSPIEAMRIVDGTKRLFRAPQTDFYAAEVGLENFGYNIQNEFLMKVLEKKIKENKNIIRIFGSVKKIEVAQTNSELLTDDGQIIKASIVAACDGKNSIVRKEYGIKCKKWEYPQCAIVGSFEHTLPHNNVSMEIHDTTGPLTQVPLKAKGEVYESSLVWVVKPKDAEEKIKGEKKIMENEIEQKMQGCLGEIKLKNLQSFPLGGNKVEKFGDKNCVLLGEAAHLLPPIGAQGFNLGLRDVETFKQLLQEEKWNELAQRYHKKREKDIVRNTRNVDWLNRSLLVDFLPMQMARAMGMSVLKYSPWIRKKLMQKILKPVF